VARDENLAYERLRSAIARGVLMPNERLIETTLAATLGVGRDAIRTAFTRLAQESLIERQPNRGALVRRISEKEAIEISRRGLRSRRLQLAMQRLTRPQPTLSPCRTS